MSNMESVYNAMKVARSIGIVHNHASNVNDDGTVSINGKNVVNFGSCSYLGLERHPLLIKGAIDAMERFGVQFSSSKTYLACELYEELERELAGMLRATRAVVGATTTLLHVAALPIIVGNHDAVIFDTFVHSSVQMNLPELGKRGVKLEQCVHNDMESLERQVERLTEKYEKVVYLCDGVYSMGGEIVDVDALNGVLDRNPKLIAYIDDAHGVSWSGINGAGTVLGRSEELHDRMIVVLGLSKGFCAAGGAIVMKDEELLDVVSTCGRTLVFSGPIPPPLLGIGIASAKVHSSDEIVPLQRKVIDNMHRFHEGMRAVGMSHLLSSNCTSPIVLVDIVDHTKGIDTIGKILDAGFYTNCAMYPAVPRNKAGIRLVMNAKQSFEQIDALVEVLKNVL